MRGSNHAFAEHMPKRLRSLSVPTSYLSCGCVVCEARLYHFHAGEGAWVVRVRLQARHGPPFQRAPDEDGAVGEHFGARVHAPEHEEAVARRGPHLLPAPHAPFVHLQRRHA